jgi:hypothetical protein
LPNVSVIVSDEELINDWILLFLKNGLYCLYFGGLELRIYDGMAAIAIA